MLQGLYAAASGMEAQQTQFDAISNDLANLDTPGYQASEDGFSDLLYSSGGAATGTQLATGSGTTSGVIGRSQAQGAIQATHRNLDVAVLGDGFLQVRRPDGTLGMTRNGALQIDAKRQLTDSQGNPLDPPVTIPAGVSAEQVAIGPDGRVTAGARRIGQVTLVTVPAVDKLLPDGGSVFSATAASGATRPAQGATLQSGALEGSNVDVASTMSSMIDAERTYQMASEAIHYQDQMLQIANQLRK